MLVGANSKTLLKQLTYSGYRCTVLNSSNNGLERVSIAFPKHRQAIIGTRIYLCGSDIT